MKKILHQKFTLYEFTMKQVSDMHNFVSEIVHKDLNDEYIVVTTPTDLSVLEDNQAVIRIDAKEYTLQELLDAIEKAT